MLPIKAILLPTDFSEASEHARKIAEGLARDYHARLILVHAVEPPVVANEIAGNSADTERYREAARERLTRLVEADGVVDVEVVLTDGVAASEIVRLAGDRDCSLIVIGSHGRSGLGRVLMGSVAEEVARKAPCPVVIVRSPHVLSDPTEVKTS